MSVLQYFTTVPRACTSSETGESSTDGQRTQTSDDGESPSRKRQSLHCQKDLELLVTLNYLQVK